MGLDGLIISFALFGFGFLLGYLHGFEKEQSRISEAFRSENYNYEDFIDVLEKYENKKEGLKYFAKRKKKNKNNNIMGIFDWLSGKRKQNKKKK